MLVLLATILLIALAFMLPIGLTVFLAVRFVFALTVIKLVTQFITRCPVSAGDAAKAVIYSLFFTALARSPCINPAWTQVSAPWRDFWN